MTGRSTAKITSQHALVYRHLRETFDLGTARLYAEANRATSSQIGDWVRELDIDCDFEAKDAYTYTCDKLQIEDINKEAEIALELGSNAEVFPRVPLPFRHRERPSVCKRSSVQSDSISHRLADAVTKAGGYVI